MFKGDVMTSIKTLCSAAPCPVQAHGGYMPVSSFPAKGCTFPWFKCSAVLFSAVLHRITWCSISFTASQLCCVDEKGSKWLQIKVNIKLAVLLLFTIPCLQLQDREQWHLGQWMQICSLTWKWFFPARSQMPCFYGLFVPNQHKRSVYAIKGQMADENQLIFIFVRVTKLNTCVSNAFGAGFLPLFAPFSPAFHESLISIPD